MKLFCTIQINNANDIKDIDGVLCLDDINFRIGDKNIHLDFDCIDGHFVENAYFVRFKDLADTWNDLNLEDGIAKPDITIDLLKQGYVENYVMFFMKKNGERLTNMTLVDIAYKDPHSSEYLKLQIDKNAINEA